MNLNTQLYQHVSKQFEHDLNVVALVNDPSELDKLDVSPFITTVPSGFIDGLSSRDNFAFHDE